MNPTLVFKVVQDALPSERSEACSCLQHPSDEPLKCKPCKLTSRDAKVQDPKILRALAGRSILPPPISPRMRKISPPGPIPPKWNRQAKWDPQERRPYRVATSRAGAAASTLSPSESILASSRIQAQGRVFNPFPPGQDMMQHNAFGQRCTGPSGWRGSPPSPQTPSFQLWASPVGSPFPSAPSGNSQIWGCPTHDAQPISLSDLSHMAQPFIPPSNTSSRSAQSLIMSSAQASPLSTLSATATSPPTRSADSARSESPLGPSTPPPQEAPRRMFDTYEDMQSANAIGNDQNFAERISETEQEGVAKLGAEAWKSSRLRARDNAFNKGRECSVMRPSAGGKYSREQFYPEEKCVICMEGVPEVGYVPCCHLATCKECQHQLARNGGSHLCPLCRHEVANVQYLPALK